MILRAEDISNKSLRKKMGGYRLDDVENLLESIKSAYKSIQQENCSLQKNLQEMKSELSGYKEKEALIQGVMISAQKSAELSVKEANYQAEMIMKEAREKADSLIIKVKYEICDQEKVLQSLKERNFDFRSKLLDIYKEHIKLIGAFPAKDDEEEESISETFTKNTEIPPIKITDVRAQGQNKKVVSNRTSAAKGSGVNDVKEEPVCKKYTVKSLDKFSDLKFGNAAALEI